MGASGRASLFVLRLFLKPNQDWEPRQALSLPVRKGAACTEKVLAFLYCGRHAPQERAKMNVRLCAEL